MRTDMETLNLLSFTNQKMWETKPRSKLGICQLWNNSWGARNFGQWPSATSFIFFRINLHYSTWINLSHTSGANTFWVSKKISLVAPHSRQEASQGESSRACLAPIDRWPSPTLSWRNRPRWWKFSWQATEKSFHGFNHKVSKNA